MWRRLSSGLSSSALFLIAIPFLLVGCGDIEKTSDPELKPIQETLDAQLPLGTPLAIVNQYVMARGYPVEGAGKGNAMVVTIRHIDPQRLKPVTAKVTFSFDRNDKLVKTELVRTLNQNPMNNRSQGQPDTLQESQPQSPAATPSN